MQVANLEQDVLGGRVPDGRDHDLVSDFSAVTAGVLGRGVPEAVAEELIAITEIAIAMPGKNADHQLPRIERRLGVREDVAPADRFALMPKLR